MPTGEGESNMKFNEAVKALKLGWVAEATDGEYQYQMWGCKERITSCKGFLASHNRIGDDLVWNVRRETLQEINARFSWIMGGHVVQ